MTDLSPDAKELLRQARTAFSPPAGRLEAVRSALHAQIATSPGATPSISSPASGVATRALGAVGWGSGHTVASALLIGALGAGGLAAWLTVDRPGREASAPIESPARAVPASALAPAELQEQGASQPDPPSAVDPWPTRPIPPSDRAPSSKLSLAARDRTRGARAKSETTREPPLDPPSAPLPVTDSLAEEVRLLRDARSALDRGQAAQALRALNDHEEHFPRGTLYEERLATRVLAFCALGLIDGARSAAQELEHAAPRSPHLARVRASCIARPPAK